MSEPTLADSGFTDVRTGVVSAEHAALVAAALDIDPVVLADGVLPIPWHWTCFLPDASTASLGPDGHPTRRPEMAAFPNRMWVGGKVEEIIPLQIGVESERRSELLSVERKEGSTGAFWLLQVGHTISQSEHVCIEERQDIVLRAASSTPAPGADAVPPEAEWVESHEATPPLLFRFSALTFNSHRIHYDHPYATDVEGYPDLVVHGPLTATLCCGFAQARRAQPVVAFEFRARAPLFANHRFWLAGDSVDGGAEVRAVRGDGVVAMTCDIRV